jgi:hypothetical protein
MHQNTNHRYVQLVCPDDKVLAQHYYFGQPLRYYEQKIWRVPPGHSIRVVDETPFVQPEKFMRPIKKEEDVFIYSLDDSIDNIPTEPCRSLAFLKLKAFELEMFSFECPKLMYGWNAFVNREWVGTSEY